MVKNPKLGDDLGCATVKIEGNTVEEGICWI